MDKQLEKVQKEIAMAQEKLWSIMQSINKESIVIVEKQSYISQLERDIADLEQEKLLKQKQLAEETDNKNNTVKKHNEEIAMFSYTKEQLANEIEWMRKTYADIKTDCDNTKSHNETEIQEIQQKREKLLQDISKLEDIKVNLDKQIYAKDLEISDKNQELLALCSRERAIKEEIASREHDIKVIEEKTDGIVNYQKSIEVSANRLKSEVTDLNNDIVRLQDTKKTLEIDKENIVKEIETLSLEKADLIRLKISTTELVQQNDRREEYLKSKYQEAWIQFN